MLIIIRNYILLIFLSFIFILNCSAYNELSVSASSAVLIDGDTLEVLYEKSAKGKRSMASTTKIMTSLLAVESGKIDDIVTVNKKIYIEGTAIGFNEGDKITLRDLCYAMLLESGNDAAVLTANFLAGSEEKFSILMNKKAKETGMLNTNFVTASGLDDENHYTTAYDMALLGAHAVKNDIFAGICSTKTYKAEFIHPDITRNFSNHNRLLRECEGVFGIKTGFTKKSGRCLVTACKRNGKTLVAVTLNAPDDWNDHKKLYDYGFSLYENKPLDVHLNKNITIYGSDKKTISIAFDNTEIYAQKNKPITFKLNIIPHIYAPIKKFDYVGTLSVLSGEYKIKEISVYSKENAEIIRNAVEYKTGFFTRFINYFKDVFNNRKELNYDRRKSQAAKISC